MSLADTWKAPLDLLEQDLWTVEQGLFVCVGYFKTSEFVTYDILERQYTGYSKELTEKLKQEVAEKDAYWDTLGMRDLDVYISIATGERTEQSVQKFFTEKGDALKVQAAQEAIDNIVVKRDTPVRLWINTAHDTDERKVASDDGSYMNEKWTKTYFINWALRHSIELPWLKDAIAEGYVTDIVRQTQPARVEIKKAKNLRYGYFEELEVWLESNPPKSTAKPFVKYLYNDKEARDRANVTNIPSSCNMFTYEDATGAEKTIGLDAIQKAIDNRKIQNTPQNTPS